MSARSLSDALGLNQHDVFYASTVAWLLDPGGTHGTQRAVLDQFAGFVRVHQPGLAAALTAQTLQVAGKLLRPGPLPQIRIVAGTTRIALIFTTHDALGPRDRPPAGFTPLAVSFDESNSNNLLTWPLGQVLLGLEGVQCTPRWRHYLDGFCSGLRTELAQRGLTPKSLETIAAEAAPVAPAPLPAPAPAAPSPTASLTGWGDDAGWGATDSGWGAPAAPAASPATSPATSPAAAAGSAWADPGASLADAWELPGVDEAEPEPLPPPPEPTPAPAAFLDPTQLNINPDVTFTGAKTILDAAGATLLEGEAGIGQSLLEQSLSAKGGRNSPLGQSTLRVLIELQKGIGYFRLYPKEHPFCTNAIDTAHQGFVQHHEQFGALAIRIQREGAYLDDALLLADSGDLNSFSYLLYPEGIRSLNFERGLERREVHAFIDALAGQEESALTLGNDLLSNLWRRDFSHIQYLTYDQLSPQGLKNVHDPTLLPLSMRIQALVAKTGAAGADDDLDALLASAPPYEPTSAQAMAPLPEHADRYCESAPGADRQALRAMLLHSFLGDNLGRAADVVAWANGHDEYAANPGDETSFMAGMVLNALWTANLDGALDLIARAAGAGSGSLMSDELLERLGSEQFLLLLARAMLTHRQLGPLQLYKSTMRYLSRLPDTSFEAITRITCLQVDDIVREVFWKFIRSKAKDHLALMGKLTLHADPRVTEEAMKILIQLPDGRKLMQEFVTDTEHPERATKAKNLLGTATGAFSRDKDLQIIESFPIKKERLDAAKRLAQAKQAKAFERVAKLVKGKAFAKRDADEISAVFDALISVGGARSAAVLKEISERKGGLFGKADTQKVASEAARWLYELRKRGTK